MAKIELDAKKLKCPMPIIKISKAMKDMNEGDKLEVYATDPVFVPDVKAWCRKTGNELISIEEGESFAKAIIRKSA